MKKQVKKMKTPQTLAKIPMFLKTTRTVKPQITFIMMAGFLVSSCDGLSRFKHVSFTCLDNRLGIKTIELYVRSIDKRVVISDKEGMWEINPVSLSGDMLEAGDQDLKILVHLKTSKVQAMTDDLFYTLRCGKQEFEM